MTEQIPKPVDPLPPGIRCVPDEEDGYPWYYNEFDDWVEADGSPQSCWEPPTFEDLAPASTAVRDLLRSPKALRALFATLKTFGVECTAEGEPEYSRVREGPGDGIDRLAEDNRMCLAGGIYGMHGSPGEVILQIHIGPDAGKITLFRIDPTEFGSFPDAQPDVNTHKILDAGTMIEQSQPSQPSSPAPRTRAERRRALRDTRKEHKNKNKKAMAHR